MDNIRILQEITKNAILELLTEAALSVDDFYAIAQKKYGQDFIDLPTFKNAITQDPTAKRDPKTMQWNKGKYAEWIARNLKDEKFKVLANHGTLHNILSWYETHKQLLDDDNTFDFSYGIDTSKINFKDINTIPWSFLHKLYIGLKETLFTQKEIKSQCEIPFNNSEWMIVLPKTWAAEKFYGAGTKWCTASEKDSYYFRKYYSEDSPLYVNIDKRRDKNDKYYKCQFWWPSKDDIDAEAEYKDAPDVEIKKPVEDTIDMPQEVREWYAERGLEFKNGYTDEELIDMVEDDAAIIFGNDADCFLYLKQDIEEVLSNRHLEDEDSESYYIYDGENYYYDASFSKDSYLKGGDNYVVLRNSSNEKHGAFLDSKTYEWIIEKLRGYNIFNIGDDNDIFVTQTTSNNLIMAVPNKNIFFANLNEYLDIENSQLLNLHGDLFIQLQYEKKSTFMLINASKNLICVKNDIPANGEQFECNEEGLIEGKKAVYNLNGEIVQKQSVQYIKPKNVKSILDGCELVEVVDPNSESNERFFNYMKDGKLLFQHNFTKQHRISKVTNAIIVDYMLNQEYCSFINYNDGSTFPDNNNDAIIAWNDCNNGNIIFKSKANPNIIYFSVVQKKNVLGDKVLKSCTSPDTNGVMSCTTIDGERGFLTNDAFYPIPNVERIIRSTGVYMNFYEVQKTDGKSSIFCSDNKKFILQNLTDVNITYDIMHPTIIYYTKDSGNDAEAFGYIPSQNITLTFGTKVSIYGMTVKKYGTNCLIYNQGYDYRGYRGYILDKKSFQLLQPNLLSNIRFLSSLGGCILAQEDIDSNTYVLYDVTSGKKLTDQIIKDYNGLNSFTTVDGKEIKLENGQLIQN